MGLEGLKLLREAGDRFKLLVISEVMEISQISLMLPYVDIFQVGARNMQNFNLAARTGKREEARAAEARDRGDDRRVVAVRRIHHVGRKLRSHSLRARHPNFRDLHAKYARHQRHPGCSQAFASADGI